MSKSELVDIEAKLLNSTEYAVRIDDGKKSVWLPRSQIEIETTNPQKRLITVTMPEWLALERGLI